MSRKRTRRSVSSDSEVETSEDDETVLLYQMQMIPVHQVILILIVIVTKNYRELLTREFQKAIKQIKLSLKMTMNLIG